MRLSVFALLAFSAVAISACTDPLGPVSSPASAPEAVGGHSEVSISDTSDPSTGERTIFVNSKGMTRPEGSSDQFPMSFSVYYKKARNAPDRYYGVIQLMGMAEGRSALLRSCPAVAWRYGGIHYSKAILDYQNIPDLGRQNEFIFMEFTRKEISDIVKFGGAEYFIDITSGAAPGGCVNPTAVSKAEVVGLSRLLSMTEPAPAELAAEPAAP
jgi:hypothetical protein